LLFDDATKMLDELIKGKKLEGRGIIGLYPANAVEDDIELYADEDRKKVIGRLHTLRQQEEKEDGDKFRALSDFVAPKGSGVKDYVGIFAVSTGFGCDELVKKLEEQENDPYKSIMAKALADRLAEAMAEKLHEEIRREHWGYSKNEQLQKEELLEIKYQGIRPAPGYPSQPDHTEKSILWEVMKIHEQTGIELTDSLAMHPAAAVCAVVLSHPQSHYFGIGTIQKDQVESYAKRKKMKLETAERWLAPNLSYDT